MRNKKKKQSKRKKKCRYSFMSTYTAKSHLVLVPWTITHIWTVCTIFHYRRRILSFDLIHSIWKLLQAKHENARHIRVSTFWGFSITNIEVLWVQWRNLISFCSHIVSKLQSACTALSSYRHTNDVCVFDRVWNVMAVQVGLIILTQHTIKIATTLITEKSSN